jgi:hypothetical protein
MDVLKNIACDLVWRNLLRILDCKIVSTSTSTWVYAKTMEDDMNLSSFGHASTSNGYDVDSITDNAILGSRPGQALFNYSFEC